MTESRPWLKRWLVLSTAAVIIAWAKGATADDSMVTKAAPVTSAIDWSGLYVGGHLGYAWGNSNWTASPTGAPGPRISGSLSLAQPIDTFDETGSFFEGLQLGHDYMLPNRFVIGAETDISFPSFPNLAGISIGGTSTLSSPSLGTETYMQPGDLPGPMIN
jgi:high affinity Mn2+ porin